MKRKAGARTPKTHNIVSLRSDTGTIVETVYSEKERRTRFAVFRDGELSIQSRYTCTSDGAFEPVKATNNLIRHSAVLLAETPEECGTTQQLVRDIQAYIYKYLDVSDHFRKIASYYILLTWVYDAFNELPYLRLRGDYGSGKTRALLIIGSICHKVFFASGASTVSPIFHTLDTFRGTLVFDEADFRFSDEKSELVKIFNNGNVRGFPVLRTQVTRDRVFDPRAFSVFGPKIVAMRKAFDDPALESRFLTEEMGQRKMRQDIPINLPSRQKQEALALRNRLLMYRFQSLNKIELNDRLVDPALSPRLNQILTPLLSIIDDEDLRLEIREAARNFDRALYAERSGSMEAGILEVLQDLYGRDSEARISVSEITSAFASRFSGDFDRPITARLVGSVLRKRLRLTTYKSHGVYVLPHTEKPKVAELCVRFGVADCDNSAHLTSG